MSNTNPTKRNLGNRQRAKQDLIKMSRTPLRKGEEWQDSHPVSIKDKLWFLFALCMATAAYMLVHHWATHLHSRTYYLFAAAVWLSIWVLRHFRLTPPQDARSRLKAIWNAPTKYTAQGIALLALALSVYYVHYKLNQPITHLNNEDLDQLKPIAHRVYKVSGTPEIKKDTHRWAFYDEVKDAPYLTGLVEFKGRVLVVSRAPLQTELKDAIGYISVLHEIHNPHFVAYRNYIGIARNEPLYVIDLRSVWWFDAGSWALCMLLFTFNLLIYSSAVRDEKNPSRVMYIPQDLQVHLDDLSFDDVESADSSFDEEEIHHVYAEESHSENKQAENQQAENQQAENQQAENQQAGNQQAENQQAENQQAENQQAENQQAENQQAESLHS